MTFEDVFAAISYTYFLFKSFSSIKSVAKDDSNVNILQIKNNTCIIVWIEL